MFIQRKKYLRICRTVLGIQTYARGMWARQKFLQMRKNAAATIIQVIFHGCSFLKSKTLIKKMKN